MMMSFGVSSWLVRHAKNLLDLGYTCMIRYETDFKSIPKQKATHTLLPMLI